MEGVIEKELHTTVTAVQVSAVSQICAISDRYAGRGLVRAVANTVEEQMEAEEKTSRLAPNAYRLSRLSDAAVCGLYRRGKQTMSTNDLIRYVDETRAERVKETDFSETCGIYESADPRVQTADMALTVVKEEKKTARAVATVKEKLHLPLAQWFSRGEAEGREERRRLPVSAFAAIVAIAVSLMLIVASSVMLTRAESRISKLTLEAEKLSDEISELRSDTEVNGDFLTLRQIAMEEYGMVGEEYLRTTYLNSENEETIEAYEEERQGGIGLSALLSAIGIK